MKKISLFILVLVSISNVFAMEESGKTNCENMVQSKAAKVVEVAIEAPVSTSKTVKEL